MKAGWKTGVIACIALALWMGVQALALADTAPAPPPPVTPPDFGAQLHETLTALHAAGKQLAGKLVPTGEQLLAVFTAIMLGWYIFEGMMAQQLDQMFKQIINLVFMSLIALEMLLTWSGPGGINMFGFVTLGLNELSAKFVNAGDSSDNVIGAYFSAINGIYSVLSGVWADLSLHNILSGIVKMVIGSIVGQGAGPVTFIFLVVLVFVVVLVCVSVLVLAMAYALLFNTMGDFIIYLGMAIGPVFVATLVFPPASHYFSKWLEFVISGGLYKLVAVVVGDLMAVVLTEVGKNGATIVTMTHGWWWQNLGVTVEFVMYSIVLIFWSLMAYFMSKQIPLFVHSLAGGISLHASSLSSLVPSHLSNIKSPARGEASEGGASGSKSSAFSPDKAHKGKSLAELASGFPSVGPMEAGMKQIRKNQQKNKKLGNPDPQGDADDSE